MVTFGAEPAARTDTMLARLAAEFASLPGLRLTRAQIRRLLGIPDAECSELLDQLVAGGTLAQDASGHYVSGGSRHN